MDALTASYPHADFAALPTPLQGALLSLLSPRTLAVCACVCRGWWELVAEQAWQQAFAALWPPPLPPLTAAEPSRAWQLCYALRQAEARCWLGRPSTDKLIAHRTAVKACCLLPERGLLFTGGVDRTVRAWDLQCGVQLACSRRHGGTVRCVAADSALLASGSSDHAIRVWRVASSGSSGGGGHPSSSGSSSGLPFDLAGDRAVLEGHTGPVSCLQLTPSLIASGSWDCSVRLWNRASLECVAMVHTDDWVSSLAVKGSLLAAACGTSVLLFRLEGSTLTRLGSLACPSQGGGGSDVAAAVTAVDCTADGRNRQARRLWKAAAERQRQPGGAARSSWR
ncbi:F-box WD-40 repeat-containing protein [Chlorella sorokiniana]|uniref:F-box WD-40 repeat-containing protein n=1 Tax=Chlorella sorokiniana TaxID=3076 RepID=A0A2P6TJI3_CHLSO|nr:F-box WD-40 repeat-containing protein [Chlorella sorokiniana]|eukprot:PRW44244.1 F-box WD-40 repeat-containing protein [Chlorella sorokiniana]